ncbi:MAG: sigma-70 family RNA polymerase sigma factor [Rhizobiales bacterium]|nr:sigma-70 family RNA polymerase sigma factor [Hyphomicrobiales bacterium]MBI3672717.1 sigma-70 family RNA polymerase sigma factor [Hyphomicrobiales bacterium]
MTAFSAAGDGQLLPLIARVATGDRTSFGRLYDLTVNRLFAVVRAILRRPDLAEEALQETFVRVWQKASLFEEGRSPAMTWLAAIARNQAIDLGRRAAERPGESLEGKEAAAAQTVLPEAELALELKRLRDCLSQLPEDRQEMVLLAYYQGWSGEELAAQFSRPVITGKTPRRRSLFALRECIDG